MSQFNLLLEVQAITEIQHMKDKPAVVVVGRFNPLTIGHEAMIKAAHEFGEENDIPNLIVVIVAGESNSDDKEANPLSGEERKRFIESSDVADLIDKVLISENAFQALMRVRKAGFEPIAIAAGPERQKSYLGLLDTYFLDKAGKPIKHFIVPGIDRNDAIANGTKEEKHAENQKLLNKLQDGEGIEITDVSSTLVKMVVKQNMRDAFDKLTGFENNPEIGQQMFELLKQRILGEK